MPTKVTITGVVCDTDGNPLTNGSLEVKLSADASIEGVGQIIARAVTLPLDSDGVVSGSLWSTAIMRSTSPAGYTVTAYSAEGQTAWGPRQVTLPNVGTYDISGWLG